MKFSIKSLLKVYIVALLILQGLLNIRIGGLPNISFPRLLMILCYIWILFSSNMQIKFFKAVRQSNDNRFIKLYVLTCLYTALFSADINAFMGQFIDCVCLYYLVLFAVEYYFTIDEIVRIITKCLYVVCVAGLIEFFCGFNVFTVLSMGEPDVILTSYRDGLLRVSGPYGHALAYGMVLLLIFPITCYSNEDNEIDLFGHPILFFLVTLNVFFTGARSGIGIYGIEVFSLFVASSKKYKGRNFLAVITLIIVIASIAGMFSDLSIVRYSLRQIFYVVDEIFDTNFALKYGGDASIAASSIARERIWLIPFKSTTLNPWLGRGVSNIGTYVINGWKVTSIDNFYVRSYISFGIPGILAIMLLFLHFFKENIKAYLRDRNMGCIVITISVLCYMINLLYVDELSTYRYFYFLMAIRCAHINKIKYENPFLGGEN